MILVGLLLGACSPFVFDAIRNSGRKRKQQQQLIAELVASSKRLEDYVDSVAREVMGRECSRPHEWVFSEDGEGWCNVCGKPLLAA